MQQINLDSRNLFSTIKFDDENKRDQVRLLTMKKDENEMSLDELKEEVYRKIGFLETFDDDHFNKALQETNKGCFGMFLPFFNGFLKKQFRETRKRLNVDELMVKAGEILASPVVKKSLCAKLKDNDVLPIEVAYKITPVLYKMAKKDEIPVNSLLFALIARKIAEQGAAFYCLADE